MQDNYGDASLGQTYDYHNIYLTLKKFHEVVFFDYMRILSSTGKIGMNTKLIECASQGNYDLAIISLYTDQIDSISIDENI